MKYIVYLTKNLKSQINGINRIYIGVHKTENPNIFDGYLGCGVNINKPSTYMYPKTPMQYAVKKYGGDAFERTTLFIYDNKEDAYLKESELVTNDFVKLSYTYNVALGGIGGYIDLHDPHWQSKPINQFDLDGNLVKEWETTVDAADFYGYSVRKFTDASLNHTEFLNYFWSRDLEIDIKTFSKGKKQFTYLYDKNGKLIDEFNSRTECSKFLECTPQSVSNALRNELLIKGYYVSEKVVDIFQPKARKQLQKETIYLYNVNGDFLGSFIGKEIFPVINLYSFSKINHAFNDNKGWYKDFYMSLTPVDKVPNKIHNGRKKVEIYTKDGHLIETLESLKEVKDKYNLNSPTLNKILKGIKQHEQYIFMYSK